MSHHKGPPPVGYRGAGGFAPEEQSEPRPPPPGADPGLWKLFDNVDADASDDIDASELQEALINGDWSHFDLETVNLLINIFDSDGDDRICFIEFAKLCDYLADWQRVFQKFDPDHSGTIDRAELQNALTDFGYPVTPQLLNILQRRYDVTVSKPPTKPGTPPGITFDRFVRACVLLDRVDRAFTRLDTNGDRWVQMNYLEFLRTALSLT